jgi:hypothetical protein
VLPRRLNVLPELLSNTLKVVKLTFLGRVVAVPALLYLLSQLENPALAGRR